MRRKEPGLKPNHPNLQAQDNAWYNDDVEGIASAHLMKSPEKVELRSKMKVSGGVPRRDKDRAAVSFL